LLTKPNFNSWLTLGGYVLMIFGAFLVLWLLEIYLQGRVSAWVVWPAALFAIASAGYSAFLFAQARGRDFWQSPMLFWHLVIKALLAGAAVFILVGALEFVTPYQFVSPQLFVWLINILLISLLATTTLVFSELFMKHGASDMIRASDLLLKGPLSKFFWLCVVAAGTLLPVALFFVPLGSPIPVYVATPVLALFGLWMYDHLWIKAGQAMPLS
jgi:formate-dependent nitrite reductase membrane component NrfD